MLVDTDGARHWRMDYRQVSGGETVAFGTYPQISLSEARTKRTAARKLLSDEIDLSLARRIERQAKAQSTENTFESIARKWLSNRSETWQLRTAANESPRKS